MLVDKMPDELVSLKILADQLKACSDLRSRLSVLDCDSKIAAWMQNQSPLRTGLAGLSQECELVIKSMIAIGQHDLFEESDMHVMPRIRALLNDLIPVEVFYKEIGGIVGYHYTMLSLMRSEEEGLERQEHQYHRPPGRDISSQTSEIDAYVLEGIRSLECMAELYPVGGAADRLHLIDPDTGHALPAAKLHFCGKTLLEGLIADVQAREYLFYQLFGSQVTIPIAMMTSHEKDNHRQILSIFEQNHWFGRPKTAFHFFCQPAVPLVDKEGKWCRSPDGKLLMKPGGHGVIWKMARDSGVFEAWKKQGIHKILIRQINNPIAGCDYGLLAFTGIGCLENKAFGFASCPRQVESAEGINVLLQQKEDKTIEYCLTNVEYCDFKKCGIEDKPAQEGSDYSLFPSNTNILFADLYAIEKAIEHCPIPGMIVNLKKMALLEDREAARLESTMQNIADCLIDRYEQPAAGASSDLHKTLRTFLTYHLRRKTISTTKKAFTGGSFLETPEGCFHDMLHNAFDLLTRFCQFDVPALESCEHSHRCGPAFIFLYHPALGPLYSIIAQKLRKGKLGLHSELQLDIAEIDCQELSLDGSLKITAENIMGDVSSEGLIQYGPMAGKCILKRVRVINRGINTHADQCYWKNAIVRHELCEIIIRGNGEFIAEDVSLEGSMRIEVENGFRVRAVEKKGKLTFSKEKIQAPLGRWKYRILEGRIYLSY